MTPALLVLVVPINGRYLGFSPCLRHIPLLNATLSVSQEIDLSVDGISQQSYF